MHMQDMFMNFEMPTAECSGDVNVQILRCEDVMRNASSKIIPLLRVVRCRFDLVGHKASDMIHSQNLMMSASIKYQTCSSSLLLVLGRTSVCHKTVTFHHGAVHTVFNPKMNCISGTMKRTTDKVRSKWCVAHPQQRPGRCLRDRLNDMNFKLWDGNIGRPWCRNS